MVGVWREPGVRLLVCVGTFGRKVASVALKMFSHLLYFMNKKLSHYTPRRRLWGEELYLLLILSLCIR
jgi:hypothetical protein